MEREEQVSGLVGVFVRGREEGRLARGRGLVPAYTCLFETGSTFCRAVPFAGKAQHSIFFHISISINSCICLGSWPPFVECRYRYSAWLSPAFLLL